jgi:hypothetical protein
MSPPSVRKHPEAGDRWQSFTSRELGNFRSMIICERIFNRDQGTCVLLRRSPERAIEIGGRSDLQRLNFDPQGPARAHRLLEDKRGIGIGRVPEDRHAGNSREKLCEQFQPFSAQVRCHEARPGDIAAGPRQAGNEPASDRIAGCCHNDGDRRGSAFGGKWR